MWCLIEAKASRGQASIDNQAHASAAIEVPSENQNKKYSSKAEITVGSRLEYYLVVADSPGLSIFMLQDS